MKTMNTCSLCHRSYAHAPMKIPGFMTLVGCRNCAMTLSQEIAFMVGALVYRNRLKPGDDQDMESTQ